MRLSLIAVLVTGLLVAVASIEPAGAAAPVAGWLREGAAKFAGGRYAEAEAIFTRAVGARPTDHHAWLWLGLTQFRQGEYRFAERAFARAAGLAPHNAVVLLWWGHVLVRTGHLDEAASVLRQTLVARGNPQTRQLATQALRAIGPIPEFAIEPGSATASPSAPPWAVNLDSYRAIARHYNPRLSDEEAYLVAQALLGYSRQFNLDPRLVVALVVIESGFQPLARSRAGAMGLGQLMPATARALGVNPWDPAQNLYGSIRYLRGNLDRFGWQNTHLALAAYNAGRGAVERYDGIPPYAETQWYVANVTRLYRRLLSISGKTPELTRRL
ncbi:MAG: transglycosylase SLT domain-containing protein [Armatimonadota bacterium]